MHMEMPVVAAAMAVIVFVHQIDSLQQLYILQKLSRGHIRRYGVVLVEQY